MKKRNLAAALLLLLVVIAAAAALPAVRSRVREDGRAAIREAVLRSAVECYTVEGAYPESLEYLTENYGLTINRDAYMVIYEAFASNQLPEVQVLVRGEYVR